MILRSGAIAVASRPLLRPICVASNSKFNPEQLRFQLNQLHSEAETTRAKANNARTRLIRLSEAAEKLKRQAAISVNSGKENEARELLFQKKKVMQAMEKSKSRIELLDELSAKLNEAISLKESQLIRNIVLDLEVDREDASTPVRILSPTLRVVDDCDEDKECSEVLRDDSNEDTDCSNASEDIVNKDLQYYAAGEANEPINEVLESLSEAFSDKHSIVRDQKVSSYEDFLEHIDLQLNKIEAELVNFLNVSALILNDKEKSMSSKVQQTIELLESVRAVRHRLGRIMQKKVEIA